MKLIISTLNSKYIHSSLAPWCLFSSVKKYCSNKIITKVIEGTINEDLNNIFKRIIQESPDIIGFSCYIWNINKIKKLIKIIKEKFPNIIIILGGPEVSYNSEKILKENSYINYIISGEGEYKFAELINKISNYNNSFVYDENDPPSPYTKEYFNSLHNRISYLESSRGCPYSCAFCLSGRIGKIKFYDLNRTKKEILMLAKSGTKTIKFVDRTFNCNKKRAIEIFKFIIENYNNKTFEDICFHFEIAGDILDNETIELLNSAPPGLIQLEIGLQSFNSKTLEYINRKTDVNKLKNNIKKLILYQNIHIHIDLIAGLPYENFESFSNSFNIAYNLKPHMLQLGFLKLLYGSNMRENKDKFPCNYNENPPYEVIDTPWISKKELEKLHFVEDSLERLYNSGRFKRTLKYIIQKTKYTPFELFLNFGIYISKKNINNISLNNYITYVFNFFSNQKNIYKKELRDIMVYDYLSTNSSGLIPDILKINDPKLKNIRLALDKNIKTRRPKNTKRSIAILYSKNKIIYVDYNNKNKVTNEYKIHNLKKETD